MRQVADQICLRQYQEIHRREQVKRGERRGKKEKTKAAMQRGLIAGTEAAIASLTCVGKLLDDRGVAVVKRQERRTATVITQ